MRASPLAKIAGSRRSGRTLQPSARLRDPENAAARSLLKRKSDNEATARKAKRPMAIFSTDDEASADSSPEADSPTQDVTETTTEGDYEVDTADNDTSQYDASTYEGTKAMGDADRQVRDFSCSYPHSL
jgi:hypothetical protein